MSLIHWKTCVALGRDQQREAEAAQHALSGALPAGLVLAHGDQLTGERQLFGVEPRSNTNSFADFKVMIGDVAGAAAQAGDLAGDAPGILTELVLDQAELTD